MCGIAGWYRRAGRRVDRSIITRQCDRLIQRGPDDSGLLVDGDFGFGMRRLSIIDVEGGHQPISSADGRYSIICNGEIVNHPELRRRIGSSFAFRTRSDVETLLAAYLHWGDEAWLRAEGMYAAAIWDRETRTLCLARDPLGIKPLVITEQQGGLAFASDINGLRDVPGYEFDVDERGVHDFFCFGHVLGPRSIFRQVRAIPPGHVLRLGPDGEPSLRRFWEPSLKKRDGRSEAEWVEETRERVLQTVKQHMLSDVPVGAFLSGGIDSGAVAAGMTRAADRQVTVFTAGFPGSKIDETAAARPSLAKLSAAGYRTRDFDALLDAKHVTYTVDPRATARINAAITKPVNPLKKTS